MPTGIGEAADQGRVLAGHRCQRRRLTLADAQHQRHLAPRVRLAREPVEDAVGKLALGSGRGQRFGCPRQRFHGIFETQHLHRRSIAARPRWLVLAGDAAGRPGRCGRRRPPDHRPDRAAHVRVGRPHRLPGDAAGGGAAGHDRRGRGGVPPAHDHGVPFVARGAGTGLSGGALPVAEGIVIGAPRLHRVLEVDLAQPPRAVQPGVTNLAVSRGGRAARPLLRARSLQPAGLHDRRQRRRELGRRALPQVRVHHQPRAGPRRACRPTVSWCTLGAAPEQSGLDLLGAVVGSEGTLGIVTEVWCGPAAARGGETLLATFDVDRRRGRRGVATSSRRASCRRRSR